MLHDCGKAAYFSHHLLWGIVHYFQGKIMMTGPFVELFMDHGTHLECARSLTEKGFAIICSVGGSYPTRYPGICNAILSSGCAQAPRGLFCCLHKTIFRVPAGGGIPGGPAPGPALSIGLRQKSNRISMVLVSNNLVLPIQWTYQIALCRRPFRKGHISKQGGTIPWKTK